MFGFPLYLELGYLTIDCARYWPVIWSRSLGLKLILKMFFMVMFAETPNYGHNCKLQGPAVFGKLIKAGRTQALLSINIAAQLWIMIISKYLSGLLRTV